jgi:uncharacterized damage-inducible protein DinB
MSDPRYPVGKFELKPSITRADRNALIDDVAAAPARLRDAVAGLSAAQLDTAYRFGGWTVRQVVHHVPDSHVNAYTRLKLALTEESPTIKPYDEAAWAMLPDARETPIEVSLSLLDAVHHRFVLLWRAMRDEDFARTLVHPEHGKMNLDWLLQMYAWHGKHHVGHITSLRERSGW